MITHTGRKGGGGSAHTPVESPDSLHAVSKAKILMAVSEGEIQGGVTDRDIFLDGTPLVDASGTRNFGGVYWEMRTGTQSQDYISRMPAVENEIGQDIEIKQATPWTKRITNTELDAVRVRLKFPAMAYQKDNGDTVGTRVDYRIGVSTNDGQYQWQNFAADGKTTTEYLRSHRVELPKATAHWDIRVERITADSNTQRLSNRTLIEAYDEIVDARLRYPNTALLYIEFDSKQFGNKIPKITVRMKGRQIRVPRNYDPVNRSYSGAWDGTFKMAYTNNPAWVVMDILTNKRFGAGERITVDQVDKWELYVLAQYCDQLVPNGSGGMEPRHLCDLCIQSQNSAYNVIRDIASIFNAMTAYQGNQVVIRGDIPGDVVKVVTNASIVTGQFAYQGGSVHDRHSVAMVSFSNPELNYDDDVEPVSVLSLIKRYQINQIALTAIGCTRRSEANRRGKWALLSNSSDRTVHFKTGLDGLSYKVGSIIGIADAFTAGHRMGGRVASCNGITLTVDNLPAGMIAGGNIYVNTGGGVAESRKVMAILANNQIRVDRAFSTTPQQDEVWTVDATSFTQADGSQGKPLSIQQFRVTSIVDNDDNTFSVVALVHNPSKYAAIDTGVAFTRPNISDIPSSIVPKPEGVEISSHEMIFQGLTVQTLRVQWNAVKGAIEYESQWKKDNGDWVNNTTNASLGFEVPGIYAGTYQARVRAVNSIGASSLWAEALPKTLSGKEGAPPKLTSITTIPKLWAIEVDWTFSAGSEDTSYTEIQYSPNGIDNWQNLSNVPYPASQYNHYGLKAGVLIWYRGRTIDKLGNMSDWLTVEIAGSSSTDVDEYLGDLADQFMTAEDGQRLLAELTFDPTGLIEQALSEHATVMHQMAVSDDGRADIIRIDKVLADQSQSIADVETDLIAKFGETSAQLKEKLTAYADATSANAFYTLQVGLRYNGQTYNAGMSVAAMASGGTVKTRVGFVADQLIMLSGVNGNQFSPFAIDGGQVFINNAMIKDATITIAKIAQEIGSPNWYASGAQQGWMINKDGRAYFRQVEVTGAVYANSGYFTGEIRANSGYMNNVTIADTCTILGTLNANRINGPLCQVRTATLQARKNNGNVGITYQGNPLMSMRISMVVVQGVSSVNSPKSVKYGNSIQGDVGTFQVTTGGGFNATIQQELDVGPGQTCQFYLNGSNLNDGDFFTAQCIFIATPIGSNNGGWA